MNLEKYKIPILLNIVGLMGTVVFSSYYITEGIGALLGIFMFIYIYFPSIILLSFINLFYYATFKEKTLRCFLNLLPLTFPFIYVGVKDREISTVVMASLAYILIVFINLTLNYLCFFAYTKIKKLNRKNKQE